MLAIGMFLRHLFIDNPLLNYYLLGLIKEVVNKILNSEAHQNKQNKNYSNNQLNEKNLKPRYEYLIHSNSL